MMKLLDLSRYVIATVWLFNGLYCKLFNFVPRHKAIVSNILGAEYAEQITILIGGAEVLMAIWILSKIQSRLNAILQITVVLIMNILEVILVPELLLWGKANFFFALLFIGLIYYDEFMLKRKAQQD